MCSERRPTARRSPDQIEAEERRALVLGHGWRGEGRRSGALEATGADVVVRGRRDVPWPPDGYGFDVLVNCTPVKEEVLVPPTVGMQVGRPRVQHRRLATALVVAAREAGCDVVVDGLDVLLFQGVALVRALDRELPAPIMTMRQALRGATAP